MHSRPTVLAYRDKPVMPAQISRDLEAAYVLTGSIRRSGNRLRITTQLIDTRTDFPLWTERYDREMKDVFEVQDEIAKSIAEAWRIKLTPERRLMPNFLDSIVRAAGHELDAELTLRLLEARELRAARGGAGLATLPSRRESRARGISWIYEPQPEALVIRASAGVPARRRNALSMEVRLSL